MEIIIHSVVPKALGEKIGLRQGDRILSVNSRTDLEDLFDWQFEVSGAEELELHVRHPDGSEEIYEIEKDPEDDLGLSFSSPIFTPIKTCNNACPFCFIDQQPEGLRPSLYVKDDDYRLSYFNNTYITLTNLTPRDRERIARLRPGPLYISVHATEPEVREVLLKNQKHGGKIMDELRWLKSLEIPFHCQVVLCPGINDGEHLARTLSDLATLRPEAMSVAVVPLGLTQYRENLPGLTPVDAATAQGVIDTVKAFEASHGADFVYLSDEFYYKAGLPLPDYDAYGDFPQLDDGVGTARMLTEGFYTLEPSLPPAHPEYSATAQTQKYLVLTGKLAGMVLQPIIARLNRIEGLYLDLIPVESRFWGDSVGVAGLVTGQDILDALKHQDISGYQAAVLPSVMLKHGSDEFLDGQRVDDLSRQLNLPLRVVQDPYDAQEFMTRLSLSV